jgi:hypothetical protein
MRRRRDLLLVPVVLHRMQHVLESSRHGGGLCDSDNKGVVRVVGAVEGSAGCSGAVLTGNQQSKQHMAADTSSGGVDGLVCLYA